MPTIGDLRFLSPRPLGERIKVRGISDLHSLFQSFCQRTTAPIIPVPAHRVQQDYRFPIEEPVERACPPYSRDAT